MREAGEPAPRPDPESGRELRLDLPAAHSAARMARHLVRQFAGDGGVPEDEVDKLLLIADELLTNAVDHGGGEAALEEGDLARPVRMRLSLSLRDDGWRLEVLDEGSGDAGGLERLLSGGELPDLSDERGRGLFLVRRMCASLAVQGREDGPGLRVIAVRRYVREG